MPPLQTSPEQPAAVRTISRMLGDWIDRLGSVWVEGQISALSVRAGTKTAFITLRDTDADLSLPVTVARTLIEAGETPVREGDRILVLAKPTFYVPRGSLSLRAEQVRTVGLGDLLARIERLKALLAAEGLFAPELKRKLPFLPTRVGLITGKGSAAERDVIDNARNRWHAVDFRVINTPVQGPGAVAEMIDAIARLDHDEDVDVIVIARGGGSPEELLVFSDEGLVRAVAASRTPVVSAIGHEQDSPLLDLVADVRASTPTDAARRVVPDMADELHRIDTARSRLVRAVAARIEREEAALESLRARPALADPASLIDAQSQRVDALAARATMLVSHQLTRAHDANTHLRSQLRALSPQSTLDRGYAVVQTAQGDIVRDPAQVAPHREVRIRVAGGQFAATRS